MAYFVPRTFPVIFSDMVAMLLQKTALTDLNYGSVFTTLLEVAAQEDDEQYFQMMEIIRGYQLDTTTDADLDNRASEYGVTRLSAQTSSTDVVIGDSSFDKVETTVYAGLPGAIAGAQTINGASNTDFLSAGSIVIGRGTSRVETIPYWSITDNETYFTFKLGVSVGSPSSLAYDHGTDETIILSQGGDRAINSGTVVRVPSSDLLSAIAFTLDEAGVILDGEVESELIPVTASEAGTIGNVPIGAISSFSSAPFSGATVTNPSRVTNGTDNESDQDLRDRIKDTVQTLSRGTPKSIMSGVLGATSENKRVVSATMRDATVPTDIVKVYIDDGTGFIPSYSHVGFEEVVASAQGGEKYLSIDNTPIVKAFAEVQTLEPYIMTGVTGGTGGVLNIEVGGIPETVQFQLGDFVSAIAATAQEVLTKINSESELVEARATNDGSGFRIFARNDSGEELQIVSSGTTGDTNNSFNFPTDLKYTTKLYLLRDNILRLLSKDGKTATVESGLAGPYTMTTGLLLTLIVDGATETIHKIWFNDAALSTVDDIVAYINAKASGFIATASSSGTRVSLSSGRSNSVDSKVHVLDYFDIVNINGSTGATDDTTRNYFVADNDNVILSSATPFDSIYFTLMNATGVHPSASIAPTFEYQRVGGGWESFGVIDETDGFQGTGHILFQATPDWTNAYGHYEVRITRTQNSVNYPPQGYMRMSSANGVFEFPTTEVIGEDKDYSLNRFLGQIELESPLLAGDAVVLGLDNEGVYESRAFVATPYSGGYTGLTGEVFTFYDSGVTGTVTFPGSTGMTPAQVAAAINAQVSGSYASEADGVIRLGTNRINGGSILVTGSAANDILGFSTTQVDNFVSHQPAVESAATTGLAFEVDDTLIVVIDDATEGISVPVFRGATISATGTTGAMICSELTAIFPTDAELAGYSFEILDGSYIGVTGAVESFDSSAATISVNPHFSPIAAIAATGYIEAAGVTGIVLTAKTAGITGNNITIEVRAKSGGHKTVLISNGITGNAYATDFLYPTAISATGQIASAGTAISLTAVTAGEAGNNITAVVSDIWGGGHNVLISDGITGNVYFSFEPYPTSTGQTGDIVAGINANNNLCSATGATSYISGLITGTYGFAGGVGRVGDIVAGITASSLCYAAGATSYTNELTVGDYALTGGANATTVPAIGDTIQLFPTTTSMLVDFWNNSLVSAEINLLLAVADIELLSNGEVQISSKALSEDASVFISGGNANAQLLFSAIKVIGVDAYRYFTGLAREVQWIIDGRLTDQENYPGLRAAGVQIEVVESVVVPVYIDLTVDSLSGSNLSTLTNEIKSSVSNYINKLAVGDDVLLSEIIVAVKKVSGVYDVEVTGVNNVAENLLISDNQLARTSDDKVTITGA